MQINGSYIQVYDLNVLKINSSTLARELIFIQHSSSRGNRVVGGKYALHCFLEQLFFVLEEVIFLRVSKHFFCEKQTCSAIFSIL